VAAACGDDAGDGPGDGAAPAFTGDPGSPFCRELLASDLDDPVGDGTGSPEGVRAEMERTIAAVAELVPLAPPEIADDVATLEAALRTLDEALASFGHDLEELALSDELDEVVAIANDPDLVEVGDRLTAYRTQVCEGE
jgi:hypothetical protein